MTSQRLLARLLLLLCLLSPVSAMAQVPEDMPAPNAPVYDENGVDLVSGMLDLSKEEISIGNGEDGLSRVLRFYSKDDNNRGVVKGQLDLSQTTINTVVSVGRVSAIFSYNGSSYTNIDGSGSSLVDNPVAHTSTFTTKDGSIYLFGQIGAAGGGNLITSITRPDGFQTNFYYDTIGTAPYGRLRSIRNSAGYGLFYSYSSNYDLVKISAINLAKQYCAPAPTDCSPLNADTGRSFTYTVSSTSTSTGSSTVPPGQHTTVVVASDNTSSLARTTHYALQTDITVNAGFSWPPGYPVSTSIIQQGQFTVTRPLGGSSTYLFGQSNNQNPGSGDIGNRVISVTDKGLTSNYSWQYAGLHSPLVSSVTVTLPGGGSRSATFTTAASWTRRVATLTITPTPEPARTTSFTYDASARLTNVVRPEGDSLVYAYDARGNLTTITRNPKPGSGLVAVAVTNAFPATCSNLLTCNKPDYTLDANLNRTDYTYDPTHGGVLTETAPLSSSGVRPQKRYAYQQLSAQLMGSGGVQTPAPSVWKLTSVSFCRTLASCTGTADEVVTTYTYDANLQRVTETIAAGDGSASKTTTTSFDGIGNAATVDGPVSGTADTARFVFDADRELRGKMTPDPDGAGPIGVLVKRATFDSDGNETLTESGHAVDQSDTAFAGMTVDHAVSRQFDLFGRKTFESAVAGGTTYSLTQLSYDGAGRLECSAARMNLAAYGSLPSSACVLGTSGSLGYDRITRNSYNPAGELTKVQKAYGVTVAYGFPRTLQQDYATYTYSLNGKSTSMTDANGNKASMTYDGFDHQVQWSFPDKTTPGTVSTTDYEAYTYDANGNRLSLRKRDGSVINYSYDALNRMTVKDIPGGTAADVYYGYDLRGLQLYARFVSGSGVGITNAYDSFGQLTSTTNNMSGTAKTLSYEWDAHGNRTKITHPDSTVSAPRYFTYEYDGLDRNVAIKENGSTTIVTDTYDSQGRRSGETRGGVTTAYTYDPVSRLASLSDDLAGITYDVTSGFAYNPASQIVSKSRSNDLYAFNAYPVSPISRPYTANGLNQYSAAGSTSFNYDANGNLTGDGTVTYTYDVENRMVTASGPRAATLQYDPLGRLWRFVLSNGTIEFTYDGDALVYYVSGASNGVNRYVHGNGEDDPLIRYPDASLPGRVSLQADAQGSIVSMVSADGTPLFINTYDEYGIPGTGNGGIFQYTGQVYLSWIGLYYYKARMYSPTLGRFMQTDPVGYEDQINLYTYVRNDPINAKDPTGKCFPFCLPLIAPAVWEAVTAAVATGGLIWAVNNDEAELQATVTISAAAAVRDDEIILYRGVDAAHPAYAAALLGMAVPRGGDATPSDHTLGDTESIYTSWTSDEGVAEKFATRDAGHGVVLMKVFEREEVVPSPHQEVMGESEYLVPGIVKDAYVTMVPF